MRAPPRDAGIAIAPILFVIAIIGVIIAAFASGSNSLGGAAIREDRLIADLRGQIDLIRAKVDECVMLTRQAPTYAVPNPVQFLYPDAVSPASPGTPVAVADLKCPRDPITPVDRRNLWTGVRGAALPPVPKGFQDWQYVNHGDPDTGATPGGICISIQPKDAATAGDAILQAALQSVLKRYAPSEYTFDSATQRLIIWIKKPVAPGLVC